MVTRIVMATGNAGKVAEIQSYFHDQSISFVPQSELNVGSVPETGTTFLENAIIKARHAAEVTGLPALSDDSGLMVDALGKAPGIYSARYAGEDATDIKRNEKLLNALSDVPVADRRASFYCALCFMRDAKDPAPIISVGQWHGQILLAPQGEGGFGYDPVFYVPSHDCSAAEIPIAEKNQISHRGLAMQDFVSCLQASL